MDSSPPGTLGRERVRKTQLLTDCACEEKANSSLSV